MVTILHEGQEGSTSYVPTYVCVPVALLGAVLYIRRTSAVLLACVMLREL